MFINKIKKFIFFCLSSILGNEDEPDAYELHMSVKDYCIGRRDPLVGMAVLQLKDIIDQSTFSGWCALTKRLQLNDTGWTILRILAQRNTDEVAREFVKMKSDTREVEQAKQVAAPVTANRPAGPQTTAQNAAANAKQSQPQPQQNSKPLQQPNNKQPQQNSKQNAKPSQIGVKRWLFSLMEDVFFKGDFFYSLSVTGKKVIRFFFGFISRVFSFLCGTFVLFFWHRKCYHRGARGGGAKAGDCSFFDLLSSGTFSPLFPKFRIF